PQVDLGAIEDGNAGRHGCSPQGNGPQLRGFHESRVSGTPISGSLRSRPLSPPGHSPTPLAASWGGNPFVGFAICGTRPGGSGPAGGVGRPGPTGTAGGSCARCTRGRSPHSASSTGRR